MITDHAPRAIGTCFRLSDGTLLRVAVAKGDSCKECFLYRKHCHLVHVTGSCLPEERPDGKQVIFEKLKSKVIEPNY